MRQYVDEMTIGGRDVGAVFVSLDPRVPTDPDDGSYATWAEAHAAISALPPGRKTMYVYTTGAAIVIPAGAWEMLGICLVGDLQSASVVTLETATVGVTFLNWTEGCAGIFFRHTGADPLVTISEGLVAFRSGERTTLDVTGAGPLFLVDGSEATANLFVYLEELSTFSGGVGSEVIELVSSAAVNLYLFGGSTVGANSVRGDGDGDLNFLFYGVGPLFLTQSTYLGTLSVFGTANQLVYFNEAGEADWDGTAPNDVGEAIARLAAAFAAEFGPVP